MTAPVEPTPITPGPEVPIVRNNSNEFRVFGDAFAAWIIAVVSEFFALGADTYHNALSAWGAASAAASSANASALSAGNAQDSANTAVASANTALAAPGTSATSTSSFSIGAGNKTLTIQTGKLFALSQFVIIGSTASPGNYMRGQVTAYDSVTGVMTATVSAADAHGAGTFSAWTVSMTAAPQPTLSSAAMAFAANQG